MPIGQQEARSAVVELSVRPFGNRMAGRASGRGRRETRRNVIRHVSARRLCLIPIRSVALHAIARTQRIVVVHMALRASRRRMRPGQHKSRDAVIERRRVPSRCCVALRTIPCGKCLPGGRVNRIIRLLPCRQVTLRVTAIGRLNRQIVVTVDMA